MSSKCNIITDISARRAILRKKGKCFACLKSGHIVRHCPASKFKCPKCGNSHHVSICESMKPPEAPIKPEQREQQPEVKKKETLTNVWANSGASVLLQTATAMAGNPNVPQQQKVQARIVFDSCSQKSYMSNRLKNSLELQPVNKQSLLVKTFGNDSPKLMSCDLVQVSITAVDGLEVYVNAFSVPFICSPISNHAVEVAVEKYAHLSGLDLADSSGPSDEAEIDILIGADFYWNFISNESRRGDESGPVALLTRLGWVLSGPIDVKCEEASSTTNLAATHVLRIDANPVQEELNSNMTEQLKKFWDLESVGIRDNETSVYDKFVEEIQFNGERYEAKLPFKEHHPTIPDNHAVSVKRLRRLVHRLQEQPALLTEYDSIIQDQVQKGIVEPVDPKVVAKAGSVHYLPHREVIRTDKNTTKVRVVNDASAKTTGPSLNDCLYAGPPLLH